MPPKKTPLQPPPQPFFRAGVLRMRQACAIGLNPALALLVLYGGTDKAGFTRWGAEAIGARTGMAPRRARDAIKALVDTGILRRVALKGYSGYRVEPWSEQVSRDLARLTRSQERYLRAVMAGNPPSGSDRGAYRYLVEHGWVDANGSPDERCSPAEQWIWLPTAFLGTPDVDGDFRSVTPIGKIRRAADDDAMLLRVMVDLYANQDLPSDGGISRDLVFRSFRRTLALVSRGGAWAVYKFFPGEEQYGEIADRLYLTAGARLEGETDADLRERLRPFWSRLHLLGGNCDLVELEVQVLDGSNVKRAESLFPVGFGGSSDIADQVGYEMRLAALRLMRDSGNADMRSWAERVNPTNPSSLPHLVVVDAKTINVQLAGFSRMAFLADTAATREWRTKRQRQAELYLHVFRQLAQGDGVRRLRVA